MTFEEAQALLTQNVPSIDQQILLQCYGLYKMATAGPCNTPKPAFYEFQQRAKWDAWSRLGNISADEAKERYIEIVKEINFKSGNSSSSIGVSVSTMDQAELVIGNRSMFDYAKDGNLTELQKLDLSVDEVDENNMTILHWAADRGHWEMIEYLIDLGFDCNFQDLEGSTPLHHAAYSGKDLTYSALIKGGARADIKNLDGETPQSLFDS